MSAPGVATAAGRDPDLPLAAGPAPAEQATFFVLRLGASLYALPGAAVEQIAPAVPPVRVPGSSPTVLGVIQLRERILVVIDAHAVLGASRAAATDADPPRVVAVRIDRAPFAILADAVLGVHDVPVTAVHHAEESSSRSAAAGSFELPSGVVTILDPAAFLHAVLGR